MRDGFLTIGVVKGGGGEPCRERGDERDGAIEPCFQQVVNEQHAEDAVECIGDEDGTVVGLCIAVLLFRDEMRAEEEGCPHQAWAHRKHVAEFAGGAARSVGIGADIADGDIRVAQRLVFIFEIEITVPEDGMDPGVVADGIDADNALVRRFEKLEFGKEHPKENAEREDDQWIEIDARGGDGLFFR